MRASDTDANVLKIVISWNRPGLRCRIIAEIEKDLIDVTPAPAFGRIISLDNGMLGFVKMRGRVPVRGLIAAANMAAGTADSQVKPRAADFEAFLAAARARPNCLNGVDVSAVLGHRWLHDST